MSRVYAVAEDQQSLKVWCHTFTGYEPCRVPHVHCDKRKTVSQGMVSYIRLQVMSPVLCRMYVVPCVRCGRAPPVPQGIISYEVCTCASYESCRVPCVRRDRDKQSRKVWYHAYVHTGFEPCRVRYVYHPRLHQIPRDPTGSTNRASGVNYTSNVLN